MWHWGELLCFKLQSCPSWEEGQTSWDPEEALQMQLVKWFYKDWPHGWGKGGQSIKHEQQINCSTNFRVVAENISSIFLTIPNYW